MLTIRHERTNTIPPALMALCLSLLVIRFGAIVWETANPPPEIYKISWNSTPAERDQHDLLGAKPIFYFFSSNSNTNSFRNVLSVIMERTSLNNREVINFLQDNFQPVRLESQNSLTADHLRKLYQTDDPGKGPKFVIALPDDTLINDTQWTSDRAMMEFMRSALRRRPYTAGCRYMEKRNYQQAADAFAFYARQPQLGGDQRHYGYLCSAIASLQARENSQVTAILHEALAGTKTDDCSGIVPCLRYLIGEISQAKLMKEETFSQANAKLVIGIKQLMAGDNKSARASFKYAQRNSTEDSFTRDIAKIEWLHLAVENPAEDYSSE